MKGEVVDLLEEGDGEELLGTGVGTNLLGVSERETLRGNLNLFPRCEEGSGKSWMLPCSFGGVLGIVKSKEGGVGVSLSWGRRGTVVGEVVRLLAMLNVGFWEDI